MPVYSVWMLEKQNITVSGGGNLDGVTQGDGSHLLGRTVTLNSASWKETFVFDNDADFQDTDASQTLSGAQTINGVSYANGTVVEAEYRIVLSDGLGNSWVAFGYNVNNSSPAFGTIEGLILRPDANGNFPPVGIALTVTQTGEGPSAAVTGVNPYTTYAAPPCFTPGTLISTPAGDRPVEDLAPGDLVMTRDNGPQPLRWIGRVALSPDHLAARPEHRPVSIAPGALAFGVPTRTLRLSPQHRVLVTGWKAELLFGQVEVLVPATALRNDRNIRTDHSADGIAYLHLLFDRHEIIFAEGAEVESLHAPWFARTPHTAALHAELAALFPDIFDNTAADTVARPCLTVAEGRVLAG
jgi:Hint domain